MAVEFVVEDGTVVDGATSFAALADADQYFENIGNELWDDFSTEEKQIGLNRATAYIDSVYRTLWKGIRKTSDQALTFPRINIVDSDGYVLPASPLPTVLQNATFEMAVLAADTDVDLFELDRTLGPIKRLREKVDVIEVETEYMGSADLGGSAPPNSVNEKFSEAKVWLTDLLRTKSSGRVYRS